MLPAHRTSRLLLRPMNRHHFVELHRLHRDVRAMATLGGVRTRAQTRGILAAAEEHWRAHGFGLWMAYDAGTGSFAGRGGLHRLRIEGSDMVEVVYGFLPEYWGRGLATELATECIRVGFEELRLAELAGFTLTTNLASQAVMRKLGFRYVRDFEHAGLPHQLFRLARPTA